MSGISRITALEIFSQPDDLEFVIFEKGGLFGFLITRGPGHNFKLIISTSPYAADLAQAIRGVDTTLEHVCSYATAEVGNSGSLVAAFMNPDNRPVDDANGLSALYRERIIADLTSKRTASTYTYKKGGGA